MKLYLTHTFRRMAKKLHRNQISSLEKAIKEIKVNPNIGELKVGDLAGIRVYKFRILSQLILLAYFHNTSEEAITLLYFATHENFYTELKKQLKH